MRIRANEPLFERLRVFVDGLDVTNDCVAADDKTGEVTVVVRDERGKLKLADDGRNLLMSTSRGKVDIIARPDASDDFRIRLEAIKLEQPIDAV